MSVQRRDTSGGEARWVVRLRGPDGRVTNKTFRTKGDAQRYERDQLRARDRGEWVDPRSGRLTLAEFYETWLPAQHQLRPSARRIYTDNWQHHIEPALGGASRSAASPRLSSVRGWPTWPPSPDATAP